MHTNTNIHGETQGEIEMEMEREREGKMEGEEMEIVYTPGRSGARDCCDAHWDMSPILKCIFVEVRNKRRRRTITILLTQTTQQPYFN